MLTGKAGEIWHALEPVLERAGYELVDLDWAYSPTREANSILCLYIDYPQDGSGKKVTIADCEEASHLVSLWLDESDLIEHQYTMEVSSPGMERRIRKLRDFERFTGRNVQIEMREKYQGRRKVKGQLKHADEHGILVDITSEKTEFTVPHDLVKRAQLVVDFDRLVGRKK